MLRRLLPSLTLILTVGGVSSAEPLSAQGTRLLRQPTLSATRVAFMYGADLWIVDRSGGVARRLTSTPAIESDPHFSPDGRWIAFTSNRSGMAQVYVVASDGGEPTRLTWYPAPSEARGWTPDGARVLYASSRETAPVGFDRLWTVAATGGPSSVIPAPWGWDGSYSADGRRVVVDRVTRWDWEWRSYRGGQNTPLTILDLESLDEVRLPNERTQDRYPVWIGGKIWFVSDRDWASNVWSYDVATGDVQQVTHFADAEVKWLNGSDHGLVFEQDGWIHTLDPANGRDEQLDITVNGDFPWAEPRWEDVKGRVTGASLSPSGARALFAARGEIFTVPVEHGDVRNLTRTSGVDDREAVWSPDGSEVAWFSDDGEGYELLIAPRDGLGEARRVPIGASAMAWEATWSPDGSHIAFLDQETRIRIIDVESGEISTAAVGGSNTDRGSMGLTWSPDSQWLAYATSFPNNFRRIVVWSRETGQVTPLTDHMADARSPAWDRDGRHLYFLASTDLALASGWANTSLIHGRTTYGAYVMVLRDDDPTPFPPRSDDEVPADAETPGPASPGAGDAAAPEEPQVRIDFDGIQRRIVPMPMPVANYVGMMAGPEGTVFVSERGDGAPMTIHTFSLEERKAQVFVRGASLAAISVDAKKVLLRAGGSWRVVNTGRPPENGQGTLDFQLRMHLDRSAEWAQMFDEAWRYERDFFYASNMHGNDWDAVKARYRPLVKWVRHREDLRYLFDLVNGELSVGHSFVGGGDYPDVDTTRVGLLGADLVPADGRWKIGRIYTYESWNPGLSAPLDEPGLEVAEGDYLLAVDGREVTADQDPYRALDGTVGKQTVLYLNDRPTMDGHWTVIVEPIRSEGALRQRAWVEDNRRRVDELSDGKLAYVWIPNTSGPGVTSFDRYFFAQQDKQGAVIDERFNGGGLLDDYMVDYMTRTLRAAVTNQAEGGRPLRLPQGVLGPKALIINERAGSGGDYFPWAFRQQEAGPLIGTRTWGGLVNSAVHYAMIDGGTLTAPFNAVFDPINGTWIAENEGVPPDIEVLLDARSVAAGHDPQLERAVEEVLEAVAANPPINVTHPPYPTPSKRPPRSGGGR